MFGEEHWSSQGIFGRFNAEMSCRRRKNQIFKWVETVGLPSSDICGAPSDHLRISATLDRKSWFGGGLRKRITCFPLPERKPCYLFRLKQPRQRPDLAPVSSIRWELTPLPLRSEPRGASFPTKNSTMIPVREEAAVLRSIPAERRAWLSVPEHLRVPC